MFSNNCSVPSSLSFGNNLCDTISGTSLELWHWASYKPWWVSRYPRPWARSGWGYWMKSSFMENFGFREIGNAGGYSIFDPSAHIILDKPCYSALGGNWVGSWVILPLKCCSSYQGFGAKAGRSTHRQSIYTNNVFSTEPWQRRFIRTHKELPIAQFQQNSQG